MNFNECPHCSGLKTAINHAESSITRLVKKVDDLCAFMNKAKGIIAVIILLSSIMGGAVGATMVTVAKTAFTPPPAQADPHAELLEEDT